jgi:hypothetical protein
LARLSRTVPAFNQAPESRILPCVTSPIFVPLVFVNVCVCSCILSPWKAARARARLRWLPPSGAFNVCSFNDLALQFRFRR